MSMYNCNMYLVIKKKFLFFFFAQRLSCVQCIRHQHFQGSFNTTPFGISSGQYAIPCHIWQNPVYHKKHQHVRRSCSEFLVTFTTDRGHFSNLILHHWYVTKPTANLNLDSLVIFPLFYLSFTFLNICKCQPPETRLKPFFSYNICCTLCVFHIVHSHKDNFTELQLQYPTLQHLF